MQRLRQSEHVYIPEVCPYATEACHQAGHIPPCCRPPLLLGAASVPSRHTGSVSFPHSHLTHGDNRAFIYYDCSAKSQSPKPKAQSLKPKAQSPAWHTAEPAMGMPLAALAQLAHVAQVVRSTHPPEAGPQGVASHPAPSYVSTGSGSTRPEYGKRAVGISNVGRPVSAAKRRSLGSFAGTLALRSAAITWMY